MTTLLKSIPRTVVRTTLEGMRLPLATAERITGQAANAAWPPTLMFEDFQSNALQFVGGMLRDDELVQEGRLQAVRLSELRRSTELEVQAEQTRIKADAKLERDRADAAKARTRVEQQAREREAAVARDVRQAEAALEQDARRAKQQIDKAAEGREREVQANERSARLTAVNAESEALAKQQAAISSIERVAAIDQKFESKKRQRKNS